MSNVVPDQDLCLQEQYWKENGEGGNHNSYPESAYLLESLLN